MILSAIFMKATQSDKLLICDICEYLITGPHIRLYGMGDTGEKPYTIRLHINCICMSMDISQEPKVEESLTKAAQAGVKLSYGNSLGYRRIIYESKNN